MILPMYTEQEREDMKLTLEKMVKWLENNKDMKDADCDKRSDYYKNREAEAVAVYETINDL